MTGVNRLAVLRHAKATHEPGYSDINRPLTRRGQRDAAAVGRFLRTQGIVLDLVLCSSSSRTSETWDYLAAAAQAASAQAASAQVAGAGAAGAQATSARAATAGTTGPGTTGPGTTGIVAAVGEVCYEDRIYDAGIEDLFEIIRATPATVGQLMIIGHNPAVHGLVVALTGDRDIDFPTCALAVIDLAGGWAQTSAQSGRLARFWTPQGNTR
ncbi:MAG TPA: histidine phosphatase family protein [Streptosporangiaceae bacterium]|nr:histidine phosphatase family protein [Streptosporangiaceae bacterium]